MKYVTDRSRPRTADGHLAVSIVCASCSQPFLGREGREFCSRKCWAAGQAKKYAEARVTVQCQQCGRFYKVAPRRLPESRYCSRMCSNKGVSVATAKKRGDQRRGTGKGASYIKRDNRHEHRTIAEQTIGRPLQSGEVVHHADNDKRNNDPENLVVLPSQAEHARIHFTKNRKCTVPGCGNRHVAKGLCNRHYKAEQRRAELTALLEAAKA